jgi:hypothetical protein
MLITDPRLGGPKRAARFFQLLKEERISNELIFELFFPAKDDLFQAINESVPRWSLQITIETPIEKLRRLDRLKFAVPNSEVEETIGSALSHGCNRLDLFFMVGLPHQTYEDVMSTVPYCERLLKLADGDRRLRFFVSPLGPFLDPGCGAFEDPSNGCTHFYGSLEEHRRALLFHTWKSILSYETDSMTREQIINASYDVASSLNELKYRHGLIDGSTFRWVASQQAVAREAMKKVEEALSLPEEERASAFARIQGSLESASRDTMFSKRELDWPNDEGLRVGGSLLLALVNGLVRETAYSLFRAVGRYDTEVYSGKRAPALVVTPRRQTREVETS